MIKTLSIKNDVARDAILVVGASLLLGLAMPFQIPLPFTPIPLALRSLLVMLLGVFLGPKRASLATIGFLAQGLIGLPVFLSGGMVGPMGGYLLGYVAASFVTGKIAENQRSTKRTFLAFLAGTFVIYLFGFFGLLPFVGSANKALMLGVVPFLPGDLFKILLGTKISKLRA